jgi:hypothetical protein
MDHAYRLPGRFLFGDSDAVYVEAVSKGIFLGPFVGLSIIVICFRNLKAKRYLWVLGLLAFPIWVAYKDFSAYHVKHALSHAPHDERRSFLHAKEE